MRRGPCSERVLATVLFTDIVGSTERAAELGDRRWRELVARHHATVRAQLKRFRGREIDTAGDGFLATFERPARAIDCALAIIAALRPLGLTIRAGVHAGELELTHGKLGGIAVHTAARVVAVAGQGEVLVTATVRDLVAGSQLEFADRGVAALKGVPGEWHLYAVVPPPANVEIETTPGGGALTTTLTAPRRVRLLAAAGVLAAGVTLVVAGVVLTGLLAAPVLPAVDSLGRVDAGGRAFDRSVAVGRRPIGLAAGSGAVWAIDFDSQTLTHVPDTGQAGDETAVGGSPTGIAFGQGSVWVTTGFGLTNGGAGAVVRFSSATEGPEANIPVGDGAGPIAYGANAIWVGDRVRDQLLRIDPATNTIAQQVPTVRAPSCIFVGGGSVWVCSTLDGVVVRLDPQTYAVQARLSVSAPTSIAVSSDAVWITSEQGDEVFRFDLASNTPTGRFPVGLGPRGIAAASDGVWVALGQGESLVRLNAATADVEARLTVDGFADGVVVDENGRVWVSVRKP